MVKMPPNQPHSIPLLISVYSKMGEPLILLQHASSPTLTPTSSSPSPAGSSPSLDEDVYRPLLSDTLEQPPTNPIKDHDHNSVRRKVIQQRSVIKDSDPSYGKTSTDFVAEIDSLLEPTGHAEGFVAANPILERLLISFGVCRFDHS
jgi:hypothetical protein